MNPKVELRDELRALSPLLEQLKSGKEGFQVPETYFQNLEGELLERIQQQERRTPVRIPWWQPLLEQWQLLLQPRYALALASVLVLVAAGGYLIVRTGPGAAPCQDIACLTAEEVRSYIETNIHDFDTRTILDAGGAGAAFDDVGLPSSVFEEGELNEDELLDALESLDPEDLETLF
ncbi:MAG: hypothetical protein IPH16_20690 [Haliscomenobacter sp.]|nr:hypothetical protein [Haliscomenobacter sp.]